MTKSDQRANLLSDHEKWPGQLATARAAQRRDSSDAPRTYPSSSPDDGSTDPGHGRQQQQADRTRRLRVVDATLAPGGRCRSRGCNAAAGDGNPSGYCTACQAVHDAAKQLRERLLARRGARLQPAHQALLDALEPADRDRLLAHLAARDAHHSHGTTGVALAGLEDFLQELRDIGLDPELLT